MSCQYNQIMIQAYLFNSYLIKTDWTMKRAFDTVLNFDYSVEVKRRRDAAEERSILETETDLFISSFYDALRMAKNDVTIVRVLFMTLATEMPHLVKLLRGLEVPSHFAYYIREADIHADVKKQWPKATKFKGVSVNKKHWSIQHLVAYAQPHCERYDKDLKAHYQIPFPVGQIKSELLVNCFERQHPQLRESRLSYLSIEQICANKKGITEVEKQLRASAREVLCNFTSFLSGIGTPEYFGVTKDEFRNNRLVWSDQMCLPWRSFCEPALRKLIVYLKFQNMVMDSAVGQTVFANLFEFIFEYFIHKEWLGKEMQKIPVEAAMKALVPRYRKHELNITPWAQNLY